MPAAYLTPAKGAIPAPPSFDIRHKERVRLLESVFDVPVGRGGTVQSMCLDNGKAQYLIKWDRRGWPCVVYRHQIERAS